MSDNIPKPKLCLRPTGPGWWNIYKNTPVGEAEGYVLVGDSVDQPGEALYVFSLDGRPHTVDSYIRIFRHGTLQWYGPLPPNPVFDNHPDDRNTDQPEDPNND